MTVDSLTPGTTRRDGRAGPVPVPWVELPQRRIGTESPTALRLLGGFDLIYRATRLRPAPVGRRLLALLGVQKAPISRAQASRILWPGVTAGSSASRMRSALYRLRQLHPEVVTLASDGGVGLGPDITVDARLLEVAAGRALEGDDRVVAAVADCEDELLPDWDDDWVWLHRERLRVLRLQALEALCERLTAGCRYVEAVAAGRAAATAAPLRESARRTLMRAYVAADREREAAAEYEAYQRELRARLALEPSAAMQGMVKALSPAVTLR